LKDERNALKDDFDKAKAQVEEWKNAKLKSRDDWEWGESVASLRTV